MNFDSKRNKTETLLLQHVQLFFGYTFGTTVNSANIISFLLVLFLIFLKKRWIAEQLEERA